MRATSISNEMLTALYRSDLPSKLEPQVLEPAQPRGIGAFFQLGAKVLHTGSGNEPPTHVDDAEAAESIHPLGDGDQASSSEAPHAASLQQSADTAPLITQSSATQEVEATKTEEPKYLRRRFSDLRSAQDILEVWFAGNHGDIGGGWHKHDSETWPLAHQALVWMVNEAQKAGLHFDAEKMAGLNVAIQSYDDKLGPDSRLVSRFQDAIHESAKEGFLHDCLDYKGGASRSSVAGWQLLEYLVSPCLISSLMNKH